MPKALELEFEVRNVSRQVPFFRVETRVEAAVVFAESLSDIPGSACCVSALPLWALALPQAVVLASTASPVVDCYWLSPS